MNGFLRSLTYLIVLLSFSASCLANPSPMTCEELFSAENDPAQALAQSEAFQRDEEAALAKTEEEALEALKQMVLTPEQTAEEIQSWTLQMKAKQASGTGLSILEHTALNYLLKSQFLETMLTPAEKTDLDLVLRTSWRHLTGKEASGTNYQGRLPKKVLYGQSRETLLFHFASFEPESRKEGLSYPSPLENYVPESHDLLVGAASSAALTALAFSDTGSTALASALFGYVTVSTIEHVLHRYAGHPSPGFKRLIKKAGWIGNILHSTGFSHAVIHHIKTYRSHTEQFQSEEEKKKLDEALASNSDISPSALSDLKGSRYGVTLQAKGMMTIVAITAPILFTMSRVFDLDPLATAALMAPISIQTMTPKVLHEYVHMKRSVALQQGGPFMKWILNTRMAELISRSHYLHHRGGGGNYNLVFGADWLLGQFRRPNLRQVFKMRELEVVGSVWDSEER